MSLLTPVALSFAFANRFRVLLQHTDNGYVLCFEKTLSPITLSEVHRTLAAPFKVDQISTEAFEAKMAQTYQQDSSTAQRLMNDISSEENIKALVQEFPFKEDLLESNDGAPIIRMINALFSEAIRDGASDIHIETFEEHLVIRFRIDGLLREVLKPQRQLGPLLVSRIKVMAKLDIAEKRVPQDGRISLRMGGRPVDVRVSIIPTRHGERIVLRLLDRNNVLHSLNSLGMAGAVYSGFREQLKQPHGIVLVTGPTGAGKSTTLYSGISEINTTRHNIMTVEDPVEYDLSGVSQTQVNTKVDMTFARGLRAILRQDPDVVMIGEIRDSETAEIAVQASLTGHLVFSTLHTNTSVGAVTRLKDMGIEPFLLASTLSAVLAQRLVRTLCNYCRIQTEPTSSERRLLNLNDHSPASLFQASGCSECDYSGYRGRTGIYELLLLDDEIRQMILDNSDEQAIKQVMFRQTGSMRDDGFAKVLAGITTLSEVLRVIRER